MEFDEHTFDGIQKQFVTIDRKDNGGSISATEINQQPHVSEGLQADSKQTVEKPIELSREKIKSEINETLATKEYSQLVKNRIRNNHETLQTQQHGNASPAVSELESNLQQHIRVIDLRLNRYEALSSDAQWLLSLILLGEDNIEELRQEAAEEGINFQTAFGELERYGLILKDQSNPTTSLSPSISYLEKANRK